MLQQGKQIRDEVKTDEILFSSHAKFLAKAKRGSDFVERAREKENKKVSFEVS